MTLRVAIVGMGGIGNNHGRCYTNHPDAKVVAVCDIIQERSDKAAEAFGCQGFYSIQTLLESGIEFDAASVTTAGVENGGDHYAPTMQLLAAGYPVLGEKPISNNLAHAEEMVAHAREKGLRYGVNLNHRFTPAAVLAKEWHAARTSRRCQYDQYDDVDQQSQRNLATLPHARASPAFA